MAADSKARPGSYFEERQAPKRAICPLWYSLLCPITKGRQGCGLCLGASTRLGDTTSCDQGTVPTTEAAPATFAHEVGTQSGACSTTL